MICENFARDAEGLVNLGINWVDDFGCELTSWRPIKNYQYDCTITKVKPCPLNNGADSFSPICVGDVTESTHNLTYFTLWDVLKHSNLLKKHIVLKIDTEGG